MSMVSFSKVLKGWICRYWVSFPEQPNKGGCQGGKNGLLVLPAHQNPYTKALGKDGILICHVQRAPYIVMLQNRQISSGIIIAALQVE